MNTYLVLFSLFVHIFTIEAKPENPLGDQSNGPRSQFENFLSKAKTAGGLLSPVNVGEAYHQYDCDSWDQEDISNVENPGFFKNKNFFNSVTAVVKEIITQIDEDILRADGADIEYTAINRELSTLETSGPVVNYINKQQAAVVLKTANLGELRMLAVRGETEDSTVTQLVIALFTAIVVYKSEGGSQQLSSGDFSSFMEEKPAEGIPGLLQTAFKEYMLGLITRERTGGISRYELENFLTTHCGFKGNLSGNFESFAEAMGEKGERPVNVSKVRNAWSKISVLAAFETLA